VTLEVREDNEVAKAAYRRAGFTPASTPQTLFWGKELG
jgi:ribosomal protein S18 acetylase RimI-like enzyme